MATCNVQTLLANAACFGCLSPGEWEILELQLLCEIFNAPTGGGSAVQTLSVAIPVGGSTVAVAHGLARVPKMLVGVLQVLSNDAASGFLAGQELSIFSMGPSAATVNLNLWADATNINVTTGSSWTTVNMRIVSTLAGGAGVATITAIPNFGFKFYFM